MLFLVISFMLLTFGPISGLFQAYFLHLLFANGTEQFTVWCV